MCHRNVSYRIWFLPKYGTKGVCAWMGVPKEITARAATAPTNRPARLRRVRIEVSLADLSPEPQLGRNGSHLTVSPAGPAIEPQRPDDLEPAVCEARTMPPDSTVFPAVSAISVGSCPRDLRGSTSAQD